MKKLLLLAILLLTSPVLSYPRENGSDSGDADKPGRYKHHIGASLGYVAGPGISYRYWINGRYGVQTSLYPYYYKVGSEKDVNLSLSLLGLRMLNETERLNLFAYLGARVQHKSHTGGGDIDPYETEDNFLHIGGGPGIELKANRLSLNVMVGIRGMTDFDREQRIGLTAEGCVYYRF